MTGLHRDIAACRLCEAHLPHGVRPVVQFSASARLVIVGQAPGSKVHASGVPWDDASGDRLCQWTGLTREQLHDPARVAIVPMGFCYPGKASGGDRPPRRECAPLWRARAMAAMPQVELVLAIGQYAQKWHLGGRRLKSMTDTVMNWRSFLGTNEGLAVLPMPHPSWRNTAWLKKHPWFESDLLPVLRERVKSSMR